MSEPSAEAFAAVFRAAGWHYTPDLTTMTPAESRAWKAAAGALDAAVARERERCERVVAALENKLWGGQRQIGFEDAKERALAVIRSGEQP